MKNAKLENVVILGAGPAGLACAFELGRSGTRSLVIERDSEVGGLCRTVRHGGYYFDKEHYKLYKEMCPKCEGKND